MNRRRIIAAFLLSPFAGALYVVALVLFDFNRRTATNVLDPLDLRNILGIIVYVVFFAIIGYVAEITLGIPLLFLFRRVGLMTLRWFLLGSVAIGIVVWIAFAIWCVVVGLELSRSDQLYMGLIFCIPPAIISTTAFWFLGWSADNKALQLTAR